MKHIIRSLIFVLVALNLVTIAAVAEIKMETAGTAVGGSQLEVRVSGDIKKADYVTIVRPDAAEGEYARHAYVKLDKPISVEVPVQAGDWEVRYLESRTRETLARATLTVTPVSASIKIPDTIIAGAKLKVEWEGPAYRSDFITIVPADAEEGTYQRYQSAKNKKPIWLNVPDTAGSYEIRYLSGYKYTTIGRAPLIVTATSASLEAPATVKAGDKIKVAFTGPRNEKDFITIVSKGAEERTYDRYQYVRRARGDDNRIELIAPDEDGEYELRYLTGNKYNTLARRSITVQSTTASVTAPAEIIAGADFKVTWEGPGNDRDFITIVPKGADEKSYAVYAYVKRSRDNSVKLTAAEEPGEYEVRYLTGQKYKTLGSQSVTIIPVSASITSPATAEAGARIKVSWEGPGNPRDYIAIAPSGSDNRTYKGFASVRRGKELHLEAPREVGEYEVRYITGGKQHILANNALMVTKAPIPGKLRVVSSAAELENRTATQTAVGVILDASGSMLKRESGERRIDIAKRALTGLVEEGFDETTSVALRVFGHKEADSCRTDLEVPLGRVNKGALKQRIKGIEAMNLARTPIARSLELAKNDLAGATGKRVLVLVTDGEETCDGDPRKAIEDLVASDIDTRVNIVGFAIDELMLKDTFREWARAGNGTYFDARSAEELERSVLEAIQLPYEVLNTEGDVLGEGVVNGEPIEILSGTYNVRVLGDPATVFELIEVEPEKTQIVKLVR